MQSSNSGVSFNGDIPVLKIDRFEADLVLEYLYHWVRSSQQNWGPCLKPERRWCLGFKNKAEVLLLKLCFKFSKGLVVWWESVLNSLQWGPLQPHSVPQKGLSLNEDTITITIARQEANEAGIQRNRHNRHDISFLGNLLFDYFILCI